MANTTNFGWETPDDTDLVKDGAAAIRTLGSSIDTSFVDLKGGTTGQILSKASNTDLDYTWINNDQGDITEVQAGTGISVTSGTGPIPVISNTVATAFDAKGDLIVGTAADTFAKLTVGANNTVLTADDSTSTGLKWAVAASGDLNWTLLNTGGTALTGAATITVSGISNKEHFLIVIHDGSSSNASSDALIRFNADSGANYYSAGLNILGASTYAAGNLRTFDAWGTSGITVAYGSNNAASKFYGVVKVDGGKSTGIKTHTTRGTASAGGGTGHEAFSSGGIYNASAAITSISAVCTSGDWDNGTLYVYGA